LLFIEGGLAVEQGFGISPRVRSLTLCGMLSLSFEKAVKKKKKNSTPTQGDEGKYKYGEHKDMRRLYS